MIAKALFLASLITCAVTATAQASPPPPPPAPHAAHLSTSQMFRNYMQSGSIYYGPHHTAPRTL